MTTITLYPSSDALLYRLTPAGESFSAIRNGAGTAADTSTAATGCAALVADTTTDEYIQAIISLFSFDTSPVGSDGVPSAATLSIYGYSTPLYTLGDTNIVPCRGTQEDTNPDTPDYATNVQENTTAFATGIALSAWNTSGYNDFALNASGLAAISKTGTTRLHLTLEWLRANSFGGSWSSGAYAYAQCYYSEQAGTTNDPKLIVVYRFEITPSQLTATASLTAPSAVICGHDPTVSYIYTTPFDVAIT